MKNIANYIDDYLEDDLYECTSRNIKDMKDRMKGFKKGLCNDEIDNNGKTFKDRNKYRKNNKYNNQYKNKIT